MLDIGANVGWHSVVAAALGFTVLAFEPMDRNVACIRRTLCENPDMRKRFMLFATVRCCLLVGSFFG
jgi:FkbM family methyltransferase